ncbi:MAG: hypothetical protein KDE00_06305 [Rhodobacteraceae bacterium]|nr:hypothetical protein [Paracoccaceae bacterium]
MSILVLAATALPFRAAAEDVTYEGKDVERLECAAIYLAVARDAFEAEGDAQGHAAVAMASGLALLDALPGTMAQKKRALRAMGRRIASETRPEDLGDYLRSVEARCDRLDR